MKRSNLIIAVYLVLIFASGVVVGGFGNRLYSGIPASAKTTPPKPSPEQWRQQYMSEMLARLKLTPQQTTELNRILDDTRAHFREARERHDGEVKAIRAHHVESVRAILTEAQRPEYEKLRQEREQRAHPNEKNK